MSFSSWENHNENQMCVGPTVWLHLAENTLQEHLRLYMTEQDLKVRNHCLYYKNDTKIETSNRGIHHFCRPTGGSTI